MGVVGRTVLGLALCAGSAWATDIYRSTDAAGRTVYSNGPGEGSSAGEARGSATSPAHEDADDFSTSASLRRVALERDLRAAQRRLRDLDAQLATLARARVQNAGGSVSTGGVRAAAQDVRSPEEESLAAEREQVAGHVAEMRGAYAKLREEVTARLGSTPGWWIDLR